MTAETLSHNAVDRSMIQSYINNFRRYLGNYLKPNIGIKSNSFLYSNGSVLKFEFANKNEDLTKSAYSIKDALGKANLKIENSSGQIIVPTTISGTNIFVVEDKIFVIKENSVDEWTDEKAKDDIKKIVFG